jgi:hypothetical protein
VLHLDELQTKKLFGKIHESKHIFKKREKKCESELKGRKGVIDLTMKRYDNTKHVKGRFNSRIHFVRFSGGREVYPRVTLEGKENLPRGSSLITPIRAPPAILFCFCSFYCYYHYYY